MVDAFLVIYPGTSVTYITCWSRGAVDADCTIFRFQHCRFCVFLQGWLAAGGLRAGCGTGMSRRPKRWRACPTIQRSLPLFFRLQQAARLLLTFSSGYSKRSASDTRYDHPFASALQPYRFFVHSWRPKPCGGREAPE